jgi:hypothetical protein
LGNVLEPLMDCVQESSHFLLGFPFDAHSEAEGPNFHVTYCTIKNLAKQIRGLFTRKRSRTLFATTYFLNVFSYCHALIVSTGT